MRLLPHTENNCCHGFVGLLYLFCFWSFQQNLCMIHHIWGLSYVWSTTSEAYLMYDPPHPRLILCMIYHIWGLSYVWSTTSEAYLIALVMQSIDMSKHKTTTFYRFFQTFLIFFQKRITMFSNDSESLIIIFMSSSLVCIVCFSLLSADDMNLGLIVSWWHEFRFHSQLNFSYVRFFKTIYHIE